MTIIHQEFTKDGAPSMRPYLQYLLDTGAAEHVKVKWGKGHRNVIIIHGKKYQYKGGHDINNNLKKIITSLYINMSDKSLDQKKKTIKNSDNINDEHTIQVVFNIRFNNEKEHRTYSRDVFHVKGGKGSIKKAIQNEVDEVIMAVQEIYEDDGGVNAQDPDGIKIKHIYINKIKQDLTDFKNIKMFGTILEFCGYGLDKETYKYENACAVEYHVEMFNKKINQKWTVERFMDEIGMSSIDEGVSLNQLLLLYKKYRIRYHCVDVKYHKTASHNDYDYKPNTNYPVLFYMIEGQHLYPIRRAEQQTAISQIKTEQKTYHHTTKEKLQERKTHVFHHPDEILIMHEPHCQIFDLKECSRDIFVCTIKGAVHTLFYNLLRKGKLHSLNVRTENNKIVQFNIGSVTIQEHATYNDVALTINTLNLMLTNQEPKYMYNGQSIHRLAHEYYERNYNKDYTSQMTPQISEIFDSIFCKNTGFNITLKNQEATHAYDFNKLYAYVLSTCNNDQYGWSQYAPTDEIQSFDGVITTGSYYIETDNCFPLRGNGFYSDAVINQLLLDNSIKLDNIKYQLKSSKSQPYDFFKDVVHSVARIFNGYKLANNGFIGLLAKNYITDIVNFSVNW